MSIYWKQALWLGGVYWIVSLILSYIDTFETYFVDLLLSVLLAIFLIPLNYIKPIKWVDNAMKKLPIVATFLTFVGWVPYLSVVIFLVATIYGFLAIFVGLSSIDSLILDLVTPISVLMVVKTACILFSFILATFFVFVNKKSIVGCLNERFKLVEGGSCNMPVVEEAYAEHTKKMYKCKKEAVERETKAKKEKAEKKEAKKVVKASKKAEKAVKKTVATKKDKISK